MKRSLYLIAEADADLEHAADWYRKQRAGLEIEFLSEVYDYFDLICDQPEIHAEPHSLGFLLRD